MWDLVEWTSKVQSTLAPRGKVFGTRFNIEIPAKKVYMTIREAPDGWPRNFKIFANSETHVMRYLRALLFTATCQ